MSMDTSPADGPSGVPSPLQVELLEELLGEGLDVELRVTGASMWPFILDGDLVTLRSAAERLGIGDVVAVLVGGPRAGGSRLMVHRVVEHQGVRLVTRGDARWDADPPADRVLGWVAGIRRDGRSVRWGLGPERRGLAWLSRRGWLAPLARRLGRWL